MKLVRIISLFLMLTIFFSLTAAPVAAQETKPNPSGAYLKFTVDVNKADDEMPLAFNYYYIKDFEYVIQEGDKLEYDVWLSIEETGWGHVDGDISYPGGRANMRDNSNFQDQEGTGFHTGQDISFYAYNRWFHRIINLGVTEEEAVDSSKSTVGSTLHFLQLSMHPSVDENNYQGYVLYDNIVITNNGEVKFVIFQNADDLNPEEMRLSHNRGSASTVEILVFTDEEMQSFQAEEEARIRAAEEREAARLEAEAQRQAEAEERARIAEEQAAQQAEAELEAENNDAENDTPIAPTLESNADDSNGISPIIFILIGIVLVVVIIIILLVKKKGGINKS